MVKTWQVILATVAIFMAGLITGGASVLGIVRWFVHHPRANSAQMGRFMQRPGNGPMQFGPQLMRSFVNQMDLTDDQRAKIAPIVKRAAAQLARERREVQLASALAIEKMQDDIAEVLTPEQRTRFEELISQQRARLQQLRQQAAPQPPAQNPRPEEPAAPK